MTAWLCEQCRVGWCFFQILGLENSNSSFRLGQVLVCFFFPCLIYPFAIGLPKAEIISHPNHSVTVFQLLTVFVVEKQATFPVMAQEYIQVGLECWMDTVIQQSRFKMHLGLYEQNVPWHKQLPLARHFFGFRDLLQGSGVTHFLRDAIISGKQTMLGSGKCFMSKGWINDLFHMYCFGCDPAVEPGV